MNSYNHATRGTYQKEDLGRQLVSFEGLLFKGRTGLQNVTPTDIDGLVQLDNENCFIFFELKHSGGMPRGQAEALEKLCDAVQAGGTDCVVILAEHNVEYPETIIAKDSIVKGLYMNGKWYRGTKGRTLKEIALGYIDYIKKERGEAT